MQEYKDHWEQIFHSGLVDLLPKAAYWFASDSALYFMSEAISHFLGHSEAGRIPAPPEADWVMGPEGNLIGRFKSTADRLRKEALGLDMGDLFCLAVHARNSIIQSSIGFSPF